MLKKLGTFEGFHFFSHDMTSERWRLDNVALKLLNFSISKKLLQLVNLRFLPNSLNLTIQFSSGISQRAVSWSVFFFYSLSFSVGKNAMLPDPRNDAVKIFLPFCAWESRGKSELHLIYIRERPQVSFASPGLSTVTKT